MGSPISSLIAEIFLQQYEDKNINHLLDTKNIAYYARYVDAILIIFDTTKISPHTVTRYINNIYSNIKLNTTYEQHNSIDFLDLTITHKYKKTGNRHIQKANCHGHNNQLPFKPPHKKNEELNFM
jgi:predicted Co/Zn/Cd cation transporter (cation efflux family)